MRQSEFEHWKMLGNEMAVDALSNSDSLPWVDLEEKLRQAMFLYNKTPSFKSLYMHESPKFK